MMKLLKSTQATIQVIDTLDSGEKFLIQCPKSGVIHAMRKRRFSYLQSRYFSTQFDTATDSRRLITALVGDRRVRRRSLFTNPQLLDVLQNKSFTIATR